MVDFSKEKLQPSDMERVRVPEEQITVEAPKFSEQNLETLSWMEKIEKKFARVPNQTSDISDDTVVIQQPQTTQPPVVLPVTQQQMQIGKTTKTDSGITWLVTWAIRQIRMFTRSGRNVRLQDIPEIKSEQK